MRARRPELPPTTGVVWSSSILDAVIAVAIAGGVGVGLTGVLMLLSGMSGLGDVMNSSGLRLLFVTAVTAAAFSALLGPAFTSVHLARMRMYDGAVAGSAELRNAVEFRGQATATPFFPLQVSLFCVAGFAATMAIVFGILWSQGPVFRAVTLGCIALVVVLLLAVLVTRNRTHGPVAATIAALPKGAVGVHGPATVILRDDRTSRSVLRERDRRRRTPLHPLWVIVGWCLVAGIVVTGAAGLLRDTIGRAPLTVAWLFLAACVVALIVLHLADWLELTRLPRRLRGPAPTDAEQERGHSLTIDLRGHAVTTMAVWTLVALFAVGVELPGVGAPVVLALWLLGMILLLWLRARLERIGPALREEFGYDVPMEIPSDGNSNPG
ncbi:MULTISPECIES: hypothetical protein [unclassified Microbacterium]|uniref:hypothetical protein n=1 Tax=unclassified Microbacterium TaxID=2609290 RepID=UPI0012FBEC24|nr:hypothetical protein [Microbacterium sp. MAH-37]MVQ41383.1 hypothetical protein [Microbacterium sp. MAH-37]